MDIIFRSAFIFFTAFFFIGCSGSDGQDSDARHYQQLADSYYSGNTSVAEININSAQQFVRYFEHDDLIYAPYIHFPSFNCPEDWNRVSCPSTTQENSDLNDIDTESGVFRNVDQWGRTREGSEATTQEPIGKHYDFSCRFGGTFSIEGGIEPFDTGSFNVNFNNCQTHSDITYNGTALLKIITNAEDREESYLYMEQLTAQSNDITILVSGYIYNSAPPVGHQVTEEGTFSKTYKRYLTYQYPDKHIKENYKTSSRYSYVFGDFLGRGFDSYYVSDSSHHTSSTIYDSELGYTNIDNDLYEYRITGDITAELNFPFRELVRYSEDTNNDGQQNSGTYFYSLPTFKTSPLTDITLVNLNDLTKPPAVRAPYISSLNHLTTLSVIEAEGGYYSDDDTPTDELTVSYNWYINDELVAGQNSEFFPPYIAVFGDEVQVNIVVSDGTDTIESERSSPITIEDSPSEYMISPLPSSVSNGDIVTFDAIFTDPDISTGNEQPIPLISAPMGTNINEQGVVTWQVNVTEALFPQQSVVFTFATTNDLNSPTTSTSVLVNTSAELPIVRSGIETPTTNHSMTIGDFTGDGENEVLSTDNSHSVFLLSYNDSSYHQTWMYPFTGDNQGSIRQVIGFNVDDDAELEIFVANEHSISVINGLNNMATTLWETDKTIGAFAISDSNNDGIAEIAVLAGSQVQVFSFDEPTTLLLDVARNNANEVVFANVDGDTQHELVINSGMVYDGLTWANQWHRDSGFGETYVTAADLTGNNIAEIIGASEWGDLKVFSAVSKTELTSIDDLNTCSIQTANLDSDDANELIVGDCQWGNITAYNFENNTLTSAWVLDMQGNGSKSLTVGDSDNDGDNEVHWGTGSDIFVVANVSPLAEIQWTNSDTPRLGSFSSAGWTTIESGNEKALFFVPKTNGGYDGSIVLSMDADGIYEISEEISSNWDNSKYATAVDFNNDGYGEVFLPSTHLYDGSFSAIQLNDLTSHWSFTGDNDNDDTIGVVDAYDVNQDGYEDALYANGETLNIVDIENEISLGSISIADSNYQKDFAITHIEGDATVVIATTSAISLWTKSGSSFSNNSSVDISCDRINFVNIDNDPALELACSHIKNDFWSDESTLIIYEIENNTLVESQRTELDIGVIDFIPDTSKTSNQGFFATIQISGLSYYHDKNYAIVELNNSGQIVSQSPSIIGKPTHRGLKQKYNAETNSSEFMLSTSEAMYLFND